MSPPSLLCQLSTSGLRRLWRVFSPAYLKFLIALLVLEAQELRCVQALRWNSKIIQIPYRLHSLCIR